MARSVTPHLMFEGQAEEAMTFYVSLFSGASVVTLERYDDGKIKFATFQIAGQSINCIDSPVKHGFTFTPATSLFVGCESVEELDRLFVRLSEGGQVFMPLDNYGFSTRFGWLSDRFGVSWQLNLP